MTGGVGMDLIEIARIERALDRHPRLAGRLFTDREIGYATSMARPGRHLAARFAAKEAVVKALRLGPGTRLREIEVIPGDSANPAPVLALSGQVRKTADSLGVEVEVSLTHTKEMAGAVAIAKAGECAARGQALAAGEG